MILATGASRGIGLASAEEFAREGGTVVATDIEIEALEAAVSPLVAEGCRIETGKHDVTDVSAWRSTVDLTLERHGYTAA